MIRLVQKLEHLLVDGVYCYVLFVLKKCEKMKK